MGGPSIDRERETPVRLTKTGRIRPDTEGLIGVGLPANGLAAVSFEIVLNTPREGEDFDSNLEPFATLHADGTFSRTLLARITIGRECVLKYLALRIQKNQYSPEAAQRFLHGTTNPLIESVWQREFENLCNLSAATNAVPQLIDLSTDGNSDEPAVTVWPPLLFCKVRQLLFSTTCPRCGEVMSNCRDDALLTKHGLPTYTLSFYRFLYCPRCVVKGSDPVFYSYALPADLPEERSRGWEGLCSDMAKALREGDSQAEELLDAPRGTLSDNFPCYACGESAICSENGADEATGHTLEERLVPFSFYETFVICTDLLHFHYDEFCDLLGGQSTKELRKKFKMGEKNDGQAVRLAAAESMARNKSSLLFEADGSGLDAVEIFKLKLSMFIQLCWSIYEFHRRCNQPHLCIEPRNVLVHLTEIGEYLPSFWNFQVKLTGLSSTAPFGREDNISEDLYLPPDNSSIIYTAPVIRHGQFGRIQLGDFVLTEVEEIEEMENGRLVKFAGELSSDNIFSQILSRKDLVSVTVPGSGFGINDLVLWCHLGARQSEGSGNLKLLSSSVRLEAEVVQRIKDAIGITMPSVRYALFPCFHVPCDLYSLGMMLFRTLLVNDQQELAQVELALGNVKRQLAKTLEAASDQESAQALDLMLEELGGKEYADVFDKRNVFYRSVDRLEGRPNAIPNSLWYNTLLLGLRLTTARKGVSFCEDHGDFDSRYSAGRLELVLETLEGLVRKVGAILFSRSKHSVEVRQIVDEVMVEPIKGTATASGDVE